MTLLLLVYIRNQNVLSDILEKNVNRNHHVVILQKTDVVHFSLEIKVGQDF